MNNSIHRRTFFRTCVLAIGALEVSPLHAETGEAYAIDRSWPSLLPPAYPERAQFTGIAVAKDGTILALTHGENHSDPRTGFSKQLIKRPAVLVIDPRSGQLLRAWGENLFVLPHQISVDAAGNVWIVDGVLKRVFQFDANGVKLLELGASELGLQMPTDVAVFRDGSFVVTDGALSKRGLKFDSKGQLLGKWGGRGSGPLQFHTPHSIAVDEEDQVYTVDRENHWLQVLNSDGECKATWEKVGRPLTVRYHAGSVYVLSNMSAARGIVRRFNKNGELQDSFHTKPPDSTEDFNCPHGLAIAEDGNVVYVGFMLKARRIARYRRIGPAVR
jgi:DNA-binding beta-propeller fold protein YncE